jgi:hypothetical protein
MGKTTLGPIVLGLLAMGILLLVAEVAWIRYYALLTTEERRTMTWKGYAAGILPGAALFLWASMVITLLF